MALNFHDLQQPDYHSFGDALLHGTSKALSQGLHAVGTVTEPTVTLLFDGIRSMQNIHSLNQRQAVEAGVMATRR
jgi:hypothetical protein